MNKSSVKQENKERSRKDGVRARGGILFVSELAGQGVRLDVVGTRLVGEGKVES